MKTTRPGDYLSGPQCRSGQSRDTPTVFTKNLENIFGAHKTFAAAFLPVAEMVQTLAAEGHDPETLRTLANAALSARLDVEYNTAQHNQQPELAAGLTGYIGGVSLASSMETAEPASLAERIPDGVAA